MIRGIAVKVCANFSEDEDDDDDGAGATSNLICSPNISEIVLQNRSHPSRAPVCIFPFAVTPFSVGFSSIAAPNNVADRYSGSAVVTDPPPKWECK